MLSKKHVSGLILISVLVMSNFYLVITSMLATTMVTATEQSAIGMFVSKDSYEPQLAAETFARSLAPMEINMFNSVQMALQSDVPVFIFAHGDSSELRLNGRLVTYQQLASMVNIERTNSIYLVACQSAAIEMYDSADIFEGIVGDVDAVIAGLVVALIVAQLDGLPVYTFKLISKISDRAIELKSGSEELLLPSTESGYQIAYKREYKSRTVFGVRVYQENVLWLNLDKYWCAFYFGMTGLLWRLGILIDKIPFISLNPYVALIAIALFTYAATVGLTGTQRVQNDCKAGVGGQISPTLMHSFW